jgi:hypothetical protein
MSFRDKPVPSNIFPTQAVENTSDLSLIRHTDAYQPVPTLLYQTSQSNKTNGNNSSIKSNLDQNPSAVGITDPQQKKGFNFIE